MKKTFLLFILSVVGTQVFSQQKEAAEKLVDEGVAYHDKGDYEGAIKKYDAALVLDKDNLLALAEKAMSLLSLQKPEDAIVCCKAAINAHPGDKDLKTVYVTYGNSYDALKKTDNSIEVYNEGLKQFPNYYQLYFNKGVTLASVKKYDDAILCFQHSVSCNPKHASSHNAIARLSNAKNKRIPALLAFGRFFVIEPESERAKENHSRMQEIMKGNVEKTGKNSMTINISADMLSDTTAEGKPKENSFTSTDLIMAMDAALDFEKKNKKKSEVENFIRKFGTLCSSLKETQSNNYGFYWDYYVPYFIEMKEKGFLETFGYIAFATSDDKKVKKWLKSNSKKIEEFYEWSKNFSWKSNL